MGRTIDPGCGHNQPATGAAIVLEGNRAELAAHLRELHAASTPWLACGMGSRLDWGPPSPSGTTLVSSRGLNRILEHRAEDFTVTIEAGTPLAEAQAALAEHRQWLAVDWPWGSGPGEPPANAGSIGGLVARGLAGGYRQRYLGVRDQLLGIGLLRSDGVAARAGGKVVKNVAGYDLMRLFTGSWGSLGLITEVTLRTMPQPPCRRGLVLQAPLPDLAGLSRALLRSGLTPERIDWWSAPLAASAALDAQPLLLIGLASINETALLEQVESIRSRAEGVWRILDPQQLKELEAFAAGTPSNGPGDGGGDGWLLRLGVNPDQVDTLLATTTLQGVAVTMAAGSGLGLAWSPAAALSEQQVVALRAFCNRQGGYLTVLLQPPGSGIPAWEDAPSRALIEAVKLRFDPKLQLAPGRLPGVAQSAVRA